MLPTGRGKKNPLRGEKRAGKLKKKKKKKKEKKGPLPVRGGGRRDLPIS